MPDGVQVKICGLTDIAGVQAAIAAGAAYIGFNFVPRSKRFVRPEVAATLAAEVPPGKIKVGLFADADDETLGAVLALVPLDMIQLHGAESPERVMAVRESFGLPVMKAVGVATAEDLAQLDAHIRVADQVLVDAKAAPGSLHGGNGIPFDWNLIAGRRWPVPWMLAGGLTPSNVAEAIRLTGVRQVDVASGVESAPGVKDPELIAAFCKAAGV